MNTEEYFIYLISCHLNGAVPEGTKRDDWQQVYNIADKNGVAAMAAYEIAKLPEDLRPKGKLKSLFSQSLDAAADQYLHKMKSLSVFLSALTDKKIPHLLVKGAVLRNLYPEPALRTGGDVDVIVRPADLFVAADVLKRRGFEEKSEKDSEIQLLLDGDVFEINTELESINIQSKIYFSTPFDDISESSGYTYKLRPVYHLLYVIAHIAHHLKDGGAGIRMITDIDTIIRNYPDIDMQAFLQLCDNIKIRKTAEALIALSKKWFGTPVAINFTFEDEETVPLFENLTEVITSGGTFSPESSKKVSHMSENSEKFKVKRLFTAVPFVFGRKKSKEAFDCGSEISQAERALFTELEINVERES